MKEFRRGESSRRKHSTFLTVSAEALGEGGGVGDVIGGVLLWHQGDDGAICYLSISATHTHTHTVKMLKSLLLLSLPACLPASVWRRHAYLVVSQRVEPLPVVVDLCGDVFILQNYPSHPTLPPL